MDAQMNMTDMWSLKLPQGLDLEVSQHPLTMRRVVNLIVALERLRVQQPAVLSSDFRDENLLSIMLDSIVEEQVVLERSATPPPHFSRTEQHQCSITDHKKRNLVLVQSSMELHAVMLQGGSANRRVHLNMSTYVHPVPRTEARPVALGIKDTNLYLSCHKEGEEDPALHLEEVEDKASLQRIGGDSDLLRFLFYKQDTGVNLSTLASARFPDWFISTAPEDDRPVMMSQAAAQCHQNFNIQRHI